MAKSSARTRVDLYRSNGSELKGFLRRRLRCEEDVEDLSQEVFLRWQTAQAATSIQKPRSFLFRIARNLLIDHLRRPRREQLSFDDPQIADTLRDTAPLPEHVVQSQEWAIAYQRALERLTPKCRTVFVQCRVDGRSHAHIAADLGISRKMVEKYMTQALVQLRDELSEFFDTEPGAA